MIISNCSLTYKLVPEALTLSLMMLNAALSDFHLCPGFILDTKLPSHVPYPAILWWLHFIFSSVVHIEGQKLLLELNIS